MFRPRHTPPGRSNIALSVSGARGVRPQSQPRRGTRGTRRTDRRR